MMKSAAGGEIGLEKCQSAAEVSALLESVQHQGQKYFNDSGVFLEYCVENARHIEVQIIGDGKGDLHQVGARDCSLQRRHQKVIEKSPASNIPSDVYPKMCEAAANLAKRSNTGMLEQLTLFMMRNRHDSSSSKSNANRSASKP